MDRGNQFIGQSGAFLDAVERASRAAPMRRPVLVIGERGTGKELIAERLHRLSTRWDEPLVTMNCAALPETLIEAELFGHEAGAFTGATRARAGRFEEADRGTLFLDELATLSMGAQERLLREHFGIGQLALVAGGSMGAQQTYEWAVRFPDKVLRAAPIAGTAQNTPHDFLLAETMREAVMSDPAWNGGEYAAGTDVAAGLKRESHIWGVVGLSTEFWKQEVWRALEFGSKDEFIVGFLEPYFTAMDPNDLLTQSWKWQRGDVARHTGGDLAAALGKITAKTFVMPIDEDQLFPVRDCKPEQELIKGSELRVVNDISGHLGLFGAVPTFMPQIDRHLSDLLDTEV